MEALFGIEFSLPVKFFIAFAIVLILIGGTAYVVRRFATGGREGAVQRGRQPRLAVVDAAPIDSRRRLVIVRRDNVEHLLLVGGPTDVLVEPNIVRGVPARETVAAPARPAAVEPAATVAIPEPAARPAEPTRPVRPAEEATPWPLQPQVEPPARPAVASVEVPTYPIAVEPPAYPAVPTPMAVVPPPAPEMSPLRAATEEIFASRPLTPVAPIANVPIAPEPVAEPFRPVLVEPAKIEAIRAEPIRVEPARQDAHLAGMVAALGESPDAATRLQPVALAQQGRQTINDDQTIADMAQRLEAALRRPSMAVNPMPQTQQPRVAPRVAAVTPAAALRGRAGDPPRGPHDALNYENLQREMANLLGRPNGSS